MRRLSLAVLFLLAACDGTPKAVNDADATTGCSIPEVLDLPTSTSMPDGQADPKPASFVLALSWSPEFCRFRGDVAEYAGQCDKNRFDFILHGLWVESANGMAPRGCAVAPPISEALVRAHYCMMPSARLMQHEWAVHGTCAFSSAESYFGAAKSLWTEVRKPNLKALRGDTLTVGDVRGAFLKANPGLPAAAVVIDRNARGWLEEVRLCLDLGYNYAACRDRGAPDSTPVTIWRGG